MSDAAEANAAHDQILWLLDRIRSSGVNSTVSVKLSQLGLKVDENLAFANVQAILERARSYGLRVRIDMEESALVDTTLDFYHRLRAAGYDNVGVVIQSYLYRSEKDVNQLVEDGARVRLVKGAYKEPPDIAYPHKEDVDRAFIRLAERMLGERARATGVFLAVASHDDAMIEATQRYARQHEHSQQRVRIPIALRHPPRPAGGADPAGLPGAHLCPLRHGLVSVFHAAPGGAAGQSLVLRGQLLPGIG